MCAKKRLPHHRSDVVRSSMGIRRGQSTCWAVYLETDAPRSPSLEMVGLYSSEKEAQAALELWEVELANFPDAHWRQSRENAGR